MERRRGPHCGYNLAGLETDGNDSATVCPECGCIWKLDEASITNRAGDDRQAQREMIRFGIFIGIVMTIIGLSMGLYTSSDPTTMTTVIRWSME